MISLCFNYIIELPDEGNMEASDRIIDAIIDAVEAEDGFCCGGVHEIGTNSYCLACKDYRDLLDD